MMHGRRIRAAAFAVTAAATVFLGFGAVAQADHPGGGGKPFRVMLSGANEVAPTNPHGTADRGSAELRLNSGQEEICFSFGALTLTAGEPLPFAGHIHEAPAGKAGRVLVTLFGRANAPTSYPTEERCVSAEREVIKEIMRNPGNYYVNLHNTPHPTGVVRAQLG